MLPYGNISERFWAKVDFTGPNGCWLWTAFIAPNGYGRFAIKPVRASSFGAHRIAYEIVFGPIPDKLTIDHLCRTRSCVNPFHLEAVTLRINTLRGDTLPARNAKKSHCPQGHPYSPENTGRAGEYGRSCRTCKRVKSLARYHRLRAQSSLPGVPSA